MKSLGYCTPYEDLFEKTLNLSALQFTFWEQVVHFIPTKMLETKDRIDQFLGIADYIGDALTYWLYIPEIGQIIAQSCV